MSSRTGASAPKANTTNNNNNNNNITDTNSTTALTNNDAVVLGDEVNNTNNNNVKVEIDMTRDVWQNITNNVRENNLEVTEINLLMVGSSYAGKTTLLKRIYGAGGGGSSKKDKNNKNNNNNDNDDNDNDNDDDDDDDNTTTKGDKKNKKNKNKNNNNNANKVKPTTALDYSFVRRNDRTASSVSHFWELAQGNELAQLSDIVMSPDSIHALVLGVVVDVGPEAWVYNQGFYLPNGNNKSNNNNNNNVNTMAVHPVIEAWDTAVYWLKRADARVHEILDKMKAKGSKTPEKLLQRALKQIGGSENPDVKKMRLSGVPTVLIINKMDLFHDSTIKMKLLTKCFRFLAHLFGAHIIFTSENETLKYKLLLHHILFQSPLDSKLMNDDCEKDAVLLTADKDTFVEIGEPSGGNNNKNNNGSSYVSGDPELDRWRNYLESYFPPPTEEETQTLLNANNNTNDNNTNNNNAAVINKSFLPLLYVQGEGGYGEATIDALRRQKDEELEQYRRANKGKKEKKEVKA